MEYEFEYCSHSNVSSTLISISLPFYFNCLVCCSACVLELDFRLKVVLCVCEAVRGYIFSGAYAIQEAQLFHLEQIQGWIRFVDVMQGKHAEAVVELSKICLVWRIFPPEESSPEMEMVAQGLDKHLKWIRGNFL
uniref:uncharacterized protein LOC105352192 n=1 Tax=Fragaria vesca subsp. vesca TaxID=101020 RepID=UPI0005CB1705|nr:PREDICTED: uncharacterized protein LOC105352192 [Fragaria vesca subsp. vesca]XP_011466869.1 PREDICTED: uncharacterized protein LOC105352192 [Fragaria vesca subsp. vesca]